MDKHFRTILASLALFTASGVSMAHSGGLNADGCHTNRKTGDYHCHRPPARPAPAQRTPNQSAQAVPPAAPASAAAARSPSAPICYTGRRGGTYTLTKSGKKNYGGC